MNYPVVAEQQLSAVSRGWWARRRGRTDAPGRPPGSVYVFQVGGQYREYPEDVPFDPCHPDVVDASSVSLVDIRSRLVEVRLAVPSASPADDFTIRASFTCAVTDAVSVARHGTVDVTVPLRAYLAGDGHLQRMGMNYGVEAVNIVREQAMRRATAYTSIVAPRILGMSVEFVSMDVLTPEDLRGWAQRCRDQQRAHDLERDKRDSEDENVHRTADLLSRGPTYIDALAVTRNDIDMAAVVERTQRFHAEDRDRGHRASELDKERAFQAAEEEKIRRNRMYLAVLEHMKDSGAFLDPQVLQQLLDAGAAADGSAPQITTGREAAEGRGAREARDGHVTDEDDLLA